MRLAYTVGIQRWPLPLYKKYRVTSHDLEPFGAGARLGLSCADGSRVSLSLGRLDRKGVKVYPDYWVFVSQSEKPRPAAVAPPPPPLVMENIPILDEE